MDAANVGCLTGLDVALACSLHHTVALRSPPLQTAGTVGWSWWPCSPVRGSATKEAQGPLCPIWLPPAAAVLLIQAVNNPTNDSMPTRHMFRGVLECCGPMLRFAVQIVCVSMGWWTLDSWLELRGIVLLACSHVEAGVLFCFC
jgi:hypothetical protein